MKPDLAIILLAAGGSRRMRGRDKLMEIVDGAPLITRQARIARAATSGPVIVALPPAPHPRYGALAGLDVSALSVADAAEGMGASLRCAVAALPDGTRAVMIFLADLPDLTETDLRTVAEAFESKPEYLVWRGATEGGRQGHPIVISAPLFPHLANLRGDAGVSAPLFPHLANLRGDAGGRDVVAAVGNKCCLVPLPGHHALADLDTPEDWAAWRAARGETG